MGTGTPNGNGSALRAGTRALTLLATPISNAVLRSLADGPKWLVDLRRMCGSPAQTTLRAYLKELEDIGAIERRRGSSFPGAVECELTGIGRDLLFVNRALQRWLERAPEGPIALDSGEARAASKALIDGWSSTMLRALAARPSSLTELDGLIAGLSYPALERRLAAMKLAGQLEPCSEERNGSGKPYAVTKWLRQGIAPIGSAASWERQHLSRSASSPIGRLDVEAAFLLALPLLRLLPEYSGTCRLGVDMSKGQSRRLVGAMAHLERGEIASCSARLGSSADAWATGSVSTWLPAVIGGDLSGLELGGDQRLARTVVEALHKALFNQATAIVELPA